MPIVIIDKAIKIVNKHFSAHSKKIHEKTFQTKCNACCIYSDRKKVLHLVWQYDVLIQLSSFLKLLLILAKNHVKYIVNKLLLFMLLPTVQTIGSYIFISNPPTGKNAAAEMKR